MSEYDSTFCFVPIAALQKMRGMMDPTSGVKSVTSFQIKLKPGVALEQARDDIREAFPPYAEMVMVESWKDSQGPLLAAVQLEKTTAQHLLFMIIAVAGFGILATFFMIVVEKTRDIGVLKSLAWSSWERHCLDLFGLRHVARRSRVGSWGDFGPSVCLEHQWHCQDDRVDYR